MLKKTIGQANRKAERNYEAGVTESDNVLDKYIKQHQAEIEAEKWNYKSWPRNWLKLRSWLLLETVKWRHRK